MLFGALFYLCFISFADSQYLCNGKKSNGCVCGYDKKYRYTIDCSLMDLDKIPDNTQLPKRYEILDLSGNELTTLSFDDSDLQSNSLLILDAKYNRIERVDAEFLRNFPNLTKLDLSHNKITKLSSDAFQGVPKLRQLDLGFNSIQILPPSVFKSLKNLKNLDLSYNDFGYQLMNYTSLFDSELGLSANLTKLGLAYLNFTYLPNGYFQDSILKSVNLADNYLSEIPKLPERIEYLDASGNYFTTLSVHQLNYHKLKILILNRLTVLDEIEDYAFYNMQELETLSLEYCPQLKEVNDMAFGNLVENEEFMLKRLSLLGNGLRKMNETYFKLFNKLDEINLASNPWNCDCDVLWFKWIEDKLVKYEDMRCASPSKFRNKIVMSLTDDELSRCSVKGASRTHKTLVAIIVVLAMMLVCVVLFLMYLGPYNNKTTKYMSTQSPYTTMVVTEEDQRHEEETK